jgi:hypothetical protein
VKATRVFLAAVIGAGLAYNVAPQDDIVAFARSRDPQPPDDMVAFAVARRIKAQSQQQQNAEQKNADPSPSEENAAQKKVL